MLDVYRNGDKLRRLWTGVGVHGLESLFHGTTEVVPCCDAFETSRHDVRWEITGLRRSSRMGGRFENSTRQAQICSGISVAICIRNIGRLKLGTTFVGHDK